MAPQPERRGNTVAIPKPAFAIGAAVASTLIAGGAVGLLSVAGDFAVLKEQVKINTDFRLQGNRYTERRGSAVEVRVSQLEQSMRKHERKPAHDLAEYRIKDMQDRCKRVEDIVDKCKEGWKSMQEGSR